MHFPISSWIIEQFPTFEKTNMLIIKKCSKLNNIKIIQINSFLVVTFSFFQIFSTAVFFAGGFSELRCSRDLTPRHN